MNVRILKAVKGKPKFKKGRIVTVTNVYAKELIESGCAEATNQPTRLKKREQKKEEEKQKEQPPADAGAEQ